MDSSTLTSINQEVYQRFPDLKGVKPRMQKVDRNTLLTYQKQVILAEQKTIHRSVRVVVDENGRIVKITTSK
jgi:hypothetical protein